VAASLGISVANVKIVSVYTGSVVVEFQILDDTAGTVGSAGGLTKIEQTLSKKLSTNSISLGAPILSYKVTKTIVQPTSSSSS
jgi:hypothetical protein